MNPRNARLILHPSLPCLLVLSIVTPSTVYGQEQLSETPEVKVVIEVEEADGPMVNAFVPPAATAATVEPSPDASEDSKRDVAETSEEPRETSETPAPAPAAARNPAVVRNLQVAAELLAEGKYLTIPGPRGSALNAYRMALATDNSNADAKAGIQRVLNVLVGKAEEARAHGNMDRARTLLESASGIVEPFVDRSALEALRASINTNAGTTVAAATTTEKETASDDKETDAAPSSESKLVAAVAESEPQAEPPAAKETKAVADNASDDAEEKTEVAEAAVEEREEAPADDTEAADAPAEVVIAALDVPPVYHVGRRLMVDLPDGMEGAVRWKVNENTVAESGDASALEYAFGEQDLGTCRIQLYRVAGGDEPVLVAEGVTEVKLFEDIPVEKSVGEFVALDPTRHGPVEGEYGVYEWRVDGEAVASEPTLTWTFDTPGAHRIECRMAEPKSEGDRAWPSPVLAWNFEVEAAEVAVAAAAPEIDPGDGAVAQVAPAPEEPRERQSSPLLVILGAAVIVLAISQAWMAYRLNCLSRSSVQAPPKSNSKPSAPLGSLPPEEDYMQELHQRFGSHETVQE